MGAVVTWLIVAILAVMLLVGVFKAARAAAVPITILVVIVLTIAVVRTFFTKDNLNKLHDTVEQTGIGAAVEQGLTGSVAKKPVEVKSEPVEVAVKPAETPVQPTQVAVTQPAVSPAPETVTVTAPVAPAPVPVDYSKYDKGRKSFRYALPFDATVNMSFKQGGYRFIVESLGQLSASDKKEIGQLMLQSLAKYRGESSTTVDKTKVTIDVKHDAENNRTQTFIIVPLEAVEM